MIFKFSIKYQNKDANVVKILSLERFFHWNKIFTHKKAQVRSSSCMLQKPAERNILLKCYELKQEQKECAEIALSGTNTRRNLLLDSFDL